MSETIDINYKDVLHLVSRQDGIEVVYKDSQIAIYLELREVKEKQEFLHLVLENSKNFVGSQIAVFSEAKADSIVVAFLDSR